MKAPPTRKGMKPGTVVLCALLGMICTPLDLARAEIVSCNVMVDSGKRVQVDGPCCEIPSMIREGRCTVKRFRGSVIRCGEEGRGYWRILPATRDPGSSSGFLDGAEGCWADPASVSVVADGDTSLAYKPNASRDLPATDLAARLRAKCMGEAEDYQTVIAKGIRMLRDDGLSATADELSRALDLAIPGQLAGRGMCRDTVILMEALMVKEKVTPHEAAEGIRELYMLLVPQRP